MSSLSRRVGAPPRWAAAAVGVAIVLGGAHAANAAAPAVVTRAAPAAAPVVVTRAALDPSLVSDRGASVAFSEQEAEHAATDGTVLGAGRDAYTLAAEASGRSAVQLAPGQYVEFT